jgi:hypothetical protein
MESSLIVDLWNIFKDNIDKKNIETTAETFVDLCADYGTDDVQFRDALGSDDVLDAAINYYFDEDQSDDDDDYNDEWEE